MYVPKHFEPESQTELLAFIQAYPFGVLVSQAAGKILATHIPLVLEKQEEKLVLYTHIARANKQWKEIGSQEVLVIFQEPHAFISPELYDQWESVPTWNYIAVHAYGQAQIVTNEQDGFLILEKQIDAFEAHYQQRWDSLDATYKKRMLRGIVPIEIHIQQLEGSKKLSQNKTEEEQSRIANHLLESKDYSAKKIGEYMHLGQMDDRQA